MEMDQEEAGGFEGGLMDATSVDDDVARRAYEISQGADGASPEENWLRAEQELRGIAPDTTA